MVRLHSPSILSVIEGLIHREMNYIAEQDLKRVLDFIHQQKGIDLSSYRQNFILRRLRFRINATNSENGFGYINLIKKNSDEFNRFLDTLAINVTEFFRDPDVFAVFRKVALSEIIKRKESTNNRVVRAWSAGCASGEETYSLAILIKEEVLEKENFLVRIWGTDIDNEALGEARKAEYEASRLKEVDKKRLEEYFIPLSNGSYRLKEEIRRMVRFDQHNLISDLPLKFMDIILCRNVMIYLSHHQQEILFKKFNQSLNPKGYLVIGKVETIWSDLRDLFIPVELRQKIYQKVKYEEVEG